MEEAGIFEEAEEIFGEDVGVVVATRLLKIFLASRILLMMIILKMIPIPR